MTYEPRRKSGEGNGYSMFSKGKGRRHKLAIGASAAGAALVLVSMAGQAGAATPPANVNYETGTANNLIVGSGSSTESCMDIFSIPGVRPTSAHASRICR